MAAGQVLEVEIDKLVHGGQGIGVLPDGKKALVWNVLPGEKVRFTTHKSKSSFVEGVAEEVLVRSPDREEPRDELYLSTSPWQMMTYVSENLYKREILNETLKRAHVDYDGEVNFAAPEEMWYYRNKMEYSFWGDDDGIHLALFNRGTHRKQIVQGSSIARPELDKAAAAICAELQKNKIRAGDLKSLVVRCNRLGETVAALFTRNEELPKMTGLQTAVKGIVVYYSNPKSPASVPTRQLYQYGEINLQERLRNVGLTYDVLSFFQVNLEPYETALEDIALATKDLKVTDMYAGVGSIGLSIGTQQPLRLIELDKHSAAMARQNVSLSGMDAEIIEAPSEKSTDFIPSGPGSAVVFDPPRAGLHPRVVSATLDNLPGRVVYLSCNPSTLARDLTLLQEKYEITKIIGYNFFPRTPHIETLAILNKR